VPYATAKFAPAISESAGRMKGNSSTGHGNRYLAGVLGEAAVGASSTNTFPRRTLPTDRPMPGQQTSHRRGGPVHRGHHLVDQGDDHGALSRPVVGRGGVWLKHWLDEDIPPRRLDMLINANK